MRHPGRLRRFPKNRMKELGSEVAGGSEDSQQTQPKTKNPIVRTVRPVNSCVPVSVERLDQRQRRRRKRRRRSNKHGETCEWTTNRFVHTAKGNVH